jgi:hypothetical protein
MEYNSIESQKEIDWANSTFNRQIDINRNYLTDKKLFNLTLNFTIHDWRTMRTAEYWETMKELSSIGRKEYTLICVQKYLDNLG